MGFGAKVVRKNLTGIDRQIEAARHSMRSAQWGVDTARKAVNDQMKNLNIAIETRDMVKANLEFLLEQKRKAEEEKEKEEEIN